MEYYRQRQFSLIALESVVLAKYVAGAMITRQTGPGEDFQYFISGTFQMRAVL